MSSSKRRPFTRRRNGAVAILFMSAVMISSIRAVAGSTAARAVAGESETIEVAL
jgi:hypothetical protein